ncbi:leucine-rich repeat and calponin homology domain-containing protein 2-like [Xenia sp. Carnegie-2017]|uniref:leucine-rich repeat and calponin homology domain-containing protein 2-like n=1 Tax=Xenia sp. Carnegie-2017 TaxID=2897299 RepID=UPI001F04F4E7|nr:leucine-rich repeat and calponin homology domain-containing protein 2-like [Xenia sp. Carnegie-2017]
MTGKNISVDRCFEDAENSGTLDLSGRNLKEFPEYPEECELIDVIECDISKNRFTELPTVVCEFVVLERLNCHHNAIRSIPDTSRLTSLTWLNLSKNQLQTLPEHICGLPLQVLIVSNNRLSCIPNEICNLKHIQYLNISSNEIVSLPSTIGQLSTLRELNIHQNHLEQLPDEICKLKLEKLDFSSNRITVIPIVFRYLTTLTELVLANNPLQSPPAQLCTRGRVHIFKYLSIAAQIQDKGKDSTKSYSLAHHNASSILTEENLFPSPNEERTSRRVDRRNSEQTKNNDQSRIGRKRTTSLEAELTRADLLLTEERKLDIFGFEGAEIQSDLDSQRNGEELRETSRKLQVQLEKQKENARQKQVNESRVKMTDGSKNRRRPSASQQPAVSKVESKSSLVKNVERVNNSKSKDDSQHDRKDVKASIKYVETERRKSKKENDVNYAEDVYMPRNAEDTPFPGIYKRSQTATPSSAYAKKFTVRRMYESAREELEKVELLREAIEKRLKVRLPDDIPACLADGTVLCHLINYIRKGTIPTIFVPTPNMPKLTMSKCLKNVDHFLAACQKLGVGRDKLCNPADIVQEKNPANVWLTVEALLMETKSS